MKFKNILKDGTSYFLFEDMVTYRIPEDKSRNIINLTNCKKDDWISIDCSKPYGHWCIGGVDCSNVNGLQYYIHPPISEIDNRNLRWFGCFFRKEYNLTKKVVRLMEYWKLRTTNYHLNEKELVDALNNI